MRSRVLFLVGLAVVLVVGCVLAQKVFDEKSSRREKAASPLVTTAQSIVAPPVAHEVGKITKAFEPPTAVRVWRSDGSIDDACNKWRDAFRTWMGETNVGSVTGDVVPGQSCTFEGRKDGYFARLLVAIYASQPPEATLTVTP